MKPPKDNEYGFTSILDKEQFILCLAVVDGYANFHAKPRYKEGDVIYLKEPYREAPDGYQYKFDGDDGGKWKNKMFMPAKAARVFAEITSVKIEMLKEITVDEIVAEGIDFEGCHFSEFRHKQQA
ncbi:MAG: hypothetical protein AAFU03_06725, partial [Bacteroidota bacterium]